MREIAERGSKKHGMEVNCTEVGEKFDPQHHKPMFEAPCLVPKAGDIIQVAAEVSCCNDRFAACRSQVGVSSTPAGLNARDRGGPSGGI